MSDSDPSSLPDELGEMRTELVRASFGVDLLPEAWESLTEERRGQLLSLLAQRIGELLDQSFEQLLAILYRLDVDEAKTAAAFEAPSRPEIARRLAELVVERQLQVIRTRRQRSRPD
jgi:hypothetical protein